MKRSTTADTASGVTSRGEKPVPPIVLKRLNEAYGLDEPLWRQYIDYLWNVLHGDFGPSFTQRSRTVTDIIGHGKKALLIPRIKFREEQLLRSTILENLRLVDTLHPDKISPDSLYGRISDLLQIDDNPLESARRKGVVDIEGTGRVVSYAGDLIPILKS